MSVYGNPLTQPYYQPNSFAAAVAGPGGASATAVAGGNGYSTYTPARSYSTPVYNYSQPYAQTYQPFSFGYSQPQQQYAQYTASYPQTYYNAPQVSYGQPYTAISPNTYLVREQTQVLQPVPVYVPYAVQQPQQPSYFNIPNQYGYGQQCGYGQQYTQQCGYNTPYQQDPLVQLAQLLLGQQSPQYPSYPYQPQLVDVSYGTPINRIWGDPHVEYKDEKGNTLKYDFQGVGNKWFNAIQDGNLTVNALFTPWMGNAGSTVMTKLGFTVSDQKIAYDVDGNVSINGQTMEDGKEYTFNSGVAAQQAGQVIKGTAKWNKAANKLEIVTGEYTMSASTAGSGTNKYINLDVGTTAAGSYANGKAPDGFMGRTFFKDFANFGKGGKTGSGAQGEGFLDKKVNDYMVTDAFSMPGYTNTENVVRQWGVLAGKSADAK